MDHIKARVINRNKKCLALSVISVCSASTPYTSLCRDLEYLLKIPYIIHNDPNVPEFLIFKAVFGQVGNTFLCLKKKSQK